MKRSLDTIQGTKPVIIDIELTPFEVASRCRALPDLVFFDSAFESGEASQISIIAAMPNEVLSGKSNSDWDKLREKVRGYQLGNTVDRGIPQGFAAGYVNYDGSFHFGFYDKLLIYDHAAQIWHTIGDLMSSFSIPENYSSPERITFTSNVTRKDFCEMVRIAQEYIAAGDIYQVNLAHQFTSPWCGDSLNFYQKLRHYSPAPYGAYMALEGRSLLSSSPELFLQMSSGHIKTRPIKGTRPRYADSVADERSAYDLITSAKEIAELIMITDLERNDLGKICKYGTVKAKELLKIERYEQVFHLVSTIEGELRTEVDHVTALQSCFPGGSITGAPKKRAREIVHELEPVPRGLYTGAMGYFGFNGESQFNVAIRTVVIENSVAHFHVGAGIVADSIPENEYQETLDKAAGIILAAERM